MAQRNTQYVLPLYRKQVLKIYALNFRPGILAVAGGQRLSLRKAFQAGRRLKRWWRHKGLCFCITAGLFADFVVPVLIAELCPWVQPDATKFQHLPREEVDIYYLGSMRRLSVGSSSFFFVLFDWHSGTDVLVKQTWPPDGTASLHVVTEPEWRSATLDMFYHFTG